ncbi:hypothetical protein V8C44DRAFT_334977 [Trichoderma aethiopicum]
MMWMRHIRYELPRAPVWQVLALSCMSGYDTIQTRGTTSHDDGVSSRLVPSLVSSRLVNCQIPHQCMLACLLACLLVLLTSKCRTSGCVPFEALGE